MFRAFALAGAALLAAPAAAQTFTVAVDTAYPVQLTEDAAAVVVGNPAIADIAAHNGQLLFLTGKSFGVTNVIALNAAGETILSATVEVTAADHGRVTLHRGRGRESYRCAPACEAVAIPGDETSRFRNLIDAADAAMGAASREAGDEE